MNQHFLFLFNIFKVENVIVGQETHRTRMRIWFPVVVISTSSIALLGKPLKNKLFFRTLSHKSKYHKDVSEKFFNWLQVNLYGRSYLNQNLLNATYKVQSLAVVKCDLVTGVSIRYWTNSSQVGSSLTRWLSSMGPVAPKLFLNEMKIVFLQPCLNIEIKIPLGKEVWSKPLLCFFPIFLDNVLTIVFIKPVLIEVTWFVLRTSFKFISEGWDQSKY